MLLRLKWMLPVLLVFVSDGPARGAGDPPTIRIGLQSGISSIVFAAPSGAVSILDLSGQTPLAEAPEGARWQIIAGPTGVEIRDDQGARVGAAPSGLLLLPADGGVVRLGGVAGHWDGIADRDYRGLVEITESQGMLRVVNVVDIETYLRGVVPSEMPATYPEAALQAQAVAARGQALTKAGRHRGDGFDLCATQHCQVYGGATSEDPRSDQAVAATRGQVLEYQGRLANTLYSSNCGGHTANNEDYWLDQRPVPYLRGAADCDPAGAPLTFPLKGDALKQYLKYAPPVNCNQPRYASAAKFRWWFIAPREELRKHLAAAVGDFGELLDVRVTARGDSGVVQEIAVVGSRALEKLKGGSEIRKAMGGLNSASFAIEPIREGVGTMPVAFVIWGAGWGHQVGMCQVGAAGLAELGWDYRAILEKYYPGCNVTERY